MPVIYSVTVKIENTVHDEWLYWMQQHHIPEVLNTGCFTGCRLLKLISEPADDGTTYSIQYTCNSLADYETYRIRFSEKLQQQHALRYEGKFVAFRTLLEQVDTFSGNSHS
jgi:hypothetical protein